MAPATQQKNVPTEMESQLEVVPMVLVFVVSVSTDKI